MSSTVQWVSRILKERPSRGGGLHHWLLRASIALRRHGLTDARIIAMLADKCAGEPLKPGEIEDAVLASVSRMDDAPAGVRGGTRAAARPSKPLHPRPANEPVKPKLDVPLRNQIVAATAITVADLAEASPVHFQDETPHTDAIVRTLFPGDPLICCGAGWEHTHTRPLSSHRLLAMMQFIVPSAMSAPTGLTQKGKVSEHTLSNTGPRQFLVIEQDQGDVDSQACIIAHLADSAPLVLVVHSGGKSLHSWFHCAGQPDFAVARFFDHACRLGADAATWTPSQLVRMPDGCRRLSGGGFARQSVLYWNPERIPSC